MSRRTTISTPRVQTGTLYFVALLREELGRRIAAARISAGLSQRELAEKIHLKNASDISRYERGKVEVPSYRIDLIAEATGKTRSYFVRDPAEAEPVPADQDLRAQVEETRVMVEAILHHLGIEIPRDEEASRAGSAATSRAQRDRP